MATTTERQKEREVRSVDVGDRHIKIGRISGYKFELVFDIISAAFTEQAEINQKLEEFQQEQAQKPPVTFQFGEHRLRQNAHYGLNDEDFGDNSSITVPYRPSPGSVFLYMFPHFWQLARGKLFTLLAVLAVEDKELMEADEQNGDAAINDRIEETSRQLRFEGDVDELMDLFVVGGEALVEKFMANRDKLGELMTRFAQAQAAAAQENQAESSTDESFGKPTPGGLVSPPPQQENGMGDSPSDPTSSNGSSSSSTHSQESMDGVSDMSSSS